MKDPEEMTDEDLIQETKNAQNTVHNFEAAEGSYRAETDARDLAKAKHRALFNECMEQGIEPAEVYVSFF